MTTVSIVPVAIGEGETTYCAVAGELRSSGRTAGEALDGLSAQLDSDASATLVVVQNRRPDELFSATEQGRLSELMTRWRAVRDAGQSLPLDEQAELHALIDAEVDAAGKRAAAIMSGLRS